MNNSTWLNFQLNSPKKFVLYASRNQRAIVHEGPDNQGDGLAGMCTFQDKHIGQ